MEVVTSVTFRTNIDCCKRFMQQNSGLPIAAINPLVGDSVRVYHDSSFEILMVVRERNWILTNGSTPTLECWLGLQNGWTITMFEQMLRDRNFHV